MRSATTFLGETPTQPYSATSASAQRLHRQNRGTQEIAGDPLVIS
jgi:hypothetical protein